MRIHPKRTGTAGFTLAEVAVTIAIVGLALAMCWQGLNRAPLIAAQTRNYRLAHDLAEFTLGQLQSRSGPFEDELEDFRTDVYDEEPDFTWEVVLGDENFPEPEQDGSFNYWDWKEERQNEIDGDFYGDEDDDEEEAEQAYEKVRIRVIFPPIQDYTNEVMIERWIPWDQLYGPELEEEGEATGDEGFPGTGQ